MPSLPILDPKSILIIITSSGMKDNRKIYILTTPDLFFDLIRYPFNKGTATDTNVFLLVVGCGVPSIRLDITY